MTNTTVRVLAGDIGGTKTRLAIFDVAGTRLESRAERIFSSRDHASLGEIIDEFLGSRAGRPDTACFGVAGPVRDNASRVTNLPWHIRGDDVARQFRLRRVSLINDLEATAWGIRALGEEDFHVLNEGVANAPGNAAIIAAGTGLGEAGLFRDDTGYRPFATEGGHTDFSPGSELEIDLLRFLLQRHRHVSWERVVSGPGLVNLHAFLTRHRAREIPGWLREEMRSGDPAAAISRAAHHQRDAACTEALDLFVHLYGVETGNLALKMMATGGVYIGGGIAPKILEPLNSGRFMDAFCAKGRMRTLLENMPVRVILNDRTALYGPAIYAASATNFLK